MVGLRWPAEGPSAEECDAYDIRAQYEARLVASLTSSALFAWEGRIGIGVGHDLIVHGLVGAFL